MVRILLCNHARSEGEGGWSARWTFPVIRPHFLPTLVASCPWTSAAAVEELHEVIRQCPLIAPLDALPLLECADAVVRHYAVQCLEGATENILCDISLQLVQAMKLDRSSDSTLSRFILRQAAKYPIFSGAIFWRLYSEVAHNNTLQVGFVLAVLLRVAPSGDKMLSLTAMSHLSRLAQMITEKFKKKDERTNALRSAVSDPSLLPAEFSLPLLREDNGVGVIVPEKCRVMGSKQAPLWLTFRGMPSRSEGTGIDSAVQILLKRGDDLRQDTLTLAMLTIIDRLWKLEGLDLLVTPYDVISTGNEVGVVEVVGNAATFAQIVAETGGAGGWKAARKLWEKDVMVQWLKRQNPRPTDYLGATEVFLRSCAGASVFTYVMGIGDRHNDNIMLCEDGRVVHIDFGHILGNYKSKLGIKRERTPFIFTPHMAEVIGASGRKRFEDTCSRAYNIMRRHAALIVSLIRLMIPAGLPELRCESDVDIVIERLRLDVDDEEAGIFFAKLIDVAEKCKTTQFNDAAHLIKHY